MRLHILPNEKVVPRTIENFERVFPNGNRFVVLEGGMKLPRVEDSAHIYNCKYNSVKFWNVVGNIRKYDSIIIHFMSPESARFVLSIEHPKIYWIEWGADLYNALIEVKGFKLFTDEEVLQLCNNTKFPFAIWKLKRYFTQRILARRIHKAARKVKYFVPDSMYDEYPMILSYYPDLKNLEYKEFFYYPIDEILGTSLMSQEVIGNKIMIGNSASITGNHKHVLNLLKLKISGNQDIIVPLSYGDKKVADFVNIQGRQMFGEHFKPLLEFLPLQDYNRLMLSVSNFIYGNLRQEAVGNILIALYLGGKVFLDKRNPLLKFYKNLGIVIFDHDDITEERLNKALTSEQKTNNRNIIMTLYSKERQLSLIRQNF